MSQATQYIAAFCWNALRDINAIPFGCLVIHGGKRFRCQQRADGARYLASLGSDRFLNEPIDSTTTSYWSVAPPIMPALDHPTHACTTCAVDTGHCVCLSNTAYSTTQVPFYPVCARDSCMHALETMVMQSEHHHLFAFQHNVKGLIVRHGEQSGEIKFASGVPAIVRG